MSMNKLKRSVLLSIMLFSFFGFIAQEQLVPLSGNAILQNQKLDKTLAQKTTTTTSLQLPFFDDFSYAYKTPFPSASLWADSNVYINTGFAIQPISLGVATFEGLNKLGYPYNFSANEGMSYSADTLTSLPINLYSIQTSSSTTYYYQPSDSVFLTFYYQAEGFGDAPEPDDSLCLDFYMPLLNLWKKVWGKAGYNPSSSDTTFYRVRVGVTDTAYFHDGFKFRFRNQATTSGSVDHWHIDYVTLKDQYFYDDTVLVDVTFSYMPTSFLKNYSTIPYRQYNPATEKGTGFKNFIRNNNPGTSSSNTGALSGQYAYTVKDESGNTIPTDVYVTINNPGIPSYSYLNHGYFNCTDGVAACPVFTLYPFTSTLSVPTNFSIKHSITNVPGDIRKENDTLVHLQKFYDYYAYDDGSAEQAYYLNSYGAKTAMRFTLNYNDTLKSVKIYFDPIIKNGLVQGSSFRITVWSQDGSGKPGNVIYKDSLTNPIFTSGEYNLFANYKLTSCLPLSAGTYFIGLIQTTSQGLNIGFDRNTNHKDALYYNVSGSWVQSSIDGSLMINPVMGCADLAIGVKEHQKETFTMYPNPASESLTINTPFIPELKQTSVQIVNLLGEVVLNEELSNQRSTITISHLKNGVYFVQIKGSSINVSSQKLIISR